MNTEAILFLLSFLLLIAIVVFLLLGCSCLVGPTNQKEGFANGPRISLANPEKPAAPKPSPKPKVAAAAADEEDSDPVVLTPAETELFEDLRNNRLSSDQINDMVKANILTTSVVEKFMKKLEQNYEGETIVDPLNTKRSKKKAKEDEEEGVVEGFVSQCSSNYAPW